MSFNLVRTPVAVALAAFIASVQVSAQGRNRSGSSGETVVSDPGREHFQRGLTLADHGHWSDAILEFERARSLGPSASVHFNLAIAYRVVHRIREAAEAFESFLSIAPADTPAPVLAQARGAIQQLHGQLGSVVIDVRPPDATLLIDNEAVAIAPVLWLEPGLHTLVAVSDGRAAVTRIVRVQTGSRVNVRLTVPPQNSRARIVVNAQPERAMIRIDGSEVSQGHAEELVSIGTHRVEVSASSYDSFSRSVTMIDQQTLLINVHLEPQRTILRHPVFWTTLGVLIAGGVTTAAILATRREPAFMGPLANVEAKSL